MLCMHVPTRSYAPTVGSGAAARTFRIGHLQRLPEWGSQPTTTDADIANELISQVSWLGAMWSHGPARALYVLVSTGGVTKGQSPFSGAPHHQGANHPRGGCRHKVAGGT